MASTSEMFAEMLGLGPLFKTLNDPNFKGQVETLVRALVETGERVRRMETRLDEIFPREPEKKSIGQKF